MTTANTEVVRFELSPIQEAFWRCTDTFQDAEGATRSGKTTICLLKVIHRCEQYPGLHALISRWKDKDTDEILVPHFRELIAGDTRWQWSAQEGCFVLHHDDGPSSRVYPRGLKPSENSAPFANFAGLTIGLCYVDQLEEVDRDIFNALKARMSQKLNAPDGTPVPLEVYVSPNPPDEEHWINEEFPVGNSRARNLLCKPGHRYFRFTLRDNARNLNPQTVELLEQEYAPGHPLRRRFIFGRRGLTAKGDPVYKGYFNASIHVRSERDDTGALVPTSLLYDPALPIYEGWDFGHSSPCVTWHQLHRGGAQWVVLGGVQGKNIFLEDFAPAVIDLRRRLFVNPAWSLDRYAADPERYRYPELSLEREIDRAFLSVGDPAGATNNSQGTNRSAATVLGDLGIPIETEPTANMPDRRDYAIQVLGGYMRRKFTADDEPCFLVSDRFYRVSLSDGLQERSFLVDGFESGYVWSALSIGNTARPNTRRPAKDGVYDHSQNTCEYAVLKFAPPDAAKAAGVFHSESERLRYERQRAEADRRAQKAAQRDHDPADKWLAQRREGGYFGSGRGGDPMAGRFGRAGY